MKTICITGPESTGKTSLGRELAAKLNCPVLPEFSRTYLKDSPSYKYEDLLKIAQGQHNAEENFKGANGYRLLDTSLEVIKIWSLDKFSKVDPWIEATFQQAKVDLYLLCSPDIEWTTDPLRENPLDRDRLYSLYEEHLAGASSEYHVVTGTGTKRTQSALESILSL